MSCEPEKNQASWLQDLEIPSLWDISFSKNRKYKIKKNDWFAIRSRET